MDTNITRYNPQGGMTRLPDLVDRLFKESFVLPAVIDRSLGGASRPTLPVNLFETPDSFVMQAALPGMKADDLDIQVVGREVTIKGRFHGTEPENGKWIWQGIPTGEFYETYTLPVDLQGESTNASYDSGILTLKLPKAEHVRPKSIKVNVTR